jgi:hypothetical protein
VHADPWNPQKVYPIWTIGEKPYCANDVAYSFIRK